MNKRYNILLNTLFALTLFIVVSSCSPSDGNFQGNEILPDMAHSLAYEANYYDYYYYNTWGTEAEYYAMAKPRVPVNGTVARGYMGVHSAGSASARQKAMNLMAGEGDILKVPANGSIPYYYDDTEEERNRAMAEIINNPFPITDAGLASSKELYETFCGICHGNKGDGNGYLVSEDNPNQVYPAQPANFLSDEFINASNGRYYHSIMYGKNVMGGYADKLSYEERWQVIHYIRSLQAKSNGTVYSETANTLNAIDIPGSSIAPIAHHIDGATHGAGHHGDGHEGTTGHGHGEVHHEGATHDTGVHGTEHKVEGSHDTDGHGHDDHKEGSGEGHKHDGDDHK